MARKNTVSDPEHKALLRGLSRHFSSDEAALKRMKKKRKGPWPKGKTPKHLKKFLFK